MVSGEKPGGLSCPAPRQKLPRQTWVCISQLAAREKDRAGAFGVSAECGGAPALVGRSCPHLGEQLREQAPPGSAECFPPTGSVYNLLG